MGDKTYDSTVRKASVVSEPNSYYFTLLIFIMCYATPSPAIYCPAHGGACVLCDLTFKGWVLGPDAVIDPLLQGRAPTPAENDCKCHLCSAPKIQRHRPEERPSGVVSVSRHFQLDRPAKKSVTVRVKSWVKAL
ncbi:hypothetical protein OE88DRAFT_1733147 [Heliocybe sulcata]|uniref:Uncharacterized protein n=1 Tax=Heliocybe sulcata TaxID=5364 RepID=A0A5C3NDF9_9AGAM|nr:hypothetical protein OE88DRAFT_1733147 [Heliocybe sulcata]